MQAVFHFTNKLKIVLKTNPFIAPLFNMYWY